MWLTCIKHLPREPLKALPCQTWSIFYIHTAAPQRAQASVLSQKTLRPCLMSPPVSPPPESALLLFFFCGPILGNASPSPTLSPWQASSALPSGGEWI